MVEVNGAYKRGRYERIWLKSLHVMSIGGWLATSLSVWPVGRLTGQQDKHDSLHFPSFCLCLSLSHIFPHSVSVSPCHTCSLTLSLSLPITHVPSLCLCLSLSHTPLTLSLSLSLPVTHFSHSVSVSPCHTFSLTLSLSLSPSL